MLKAVVVTLEGQQTEEILLEELAVFPVRSPPLQPLALALALSLALALALALTLALSLALALALSLSLSLSLELALAWITVHLSASLSLTSIHKFSSWILVFLPFTSLSVLQRASPILSMKLSTKGVRLSVRLCLSVCVRQSVCVCPSVSRFQWFPVTVYCHGRHFRQQYLVENECSPGFLLLWCAAAAVCVQRGGHSPGGAAALRAVRR